MLSESPYSGYPSQLKEFGDGGVAEYGPGFFGDVMHRSIAKILNFEGVERISFVSWKLNSQPISSNRTEQYLYCEMGKEQDRPLPPKCKTNAK